MSSNPNPRRTQRATRLPQKLTDPNNVGEHEAYTQKSLATHHDNQPTLPSTPIPLTTLASAPSPIPSDPFDPPSENETDIPAAPPTSPPPSSPIRLSSESDGSGSDTESRLDFRSENSGSEEEDQQTSTAGKRKRGESTPAKRRSACHSIYALLCC